MITEKNNVFYCDCGFSFQRGRSGSHDCAEGLRNKLVESESRCAALAAELSAIEAIHSDAVFITDAHYEQCPPEVQKIIRSLAVLQIPAYQAFLAEVRASELDSLAGVAETMLVKFANQGVSDTPESKGWEMILRQASQRAAQLRKGVQS